MKSGGGQSRRRHAAAFTLIELLAVVAILALMATFIFPNLGVVRDRELRDQAHQLAAQLELARQRAVVTGVPHRLLIDLDGGGYRLEWLASQEEPQLQAPTSDAVLYDVDGATPLPLAAPTAAAASAEFEPVPGALGNFYYLESDLFFAGIDTPEGWIERGDTFVAFDRDGTGAYTEIVIDDGGGRAITLEVLPLADAVRILDAES